MLIALAISQGVFVENFEQWFRSDSNILLVKKKKKKAKNNPVFASQDRQVSQPMLDYIDTITVLTANSIYAALTVKLMFIKARLTSKHVFVEGAQKCHQNFDCVEFIVAHGTL